MLVMTIFIAIIGAIVLVNGNDTKLEVNVRMTSLRHFSIAMCQIEYASIEEEEADKKKRTKHHPNTVKREIKVTPKQVLN